MTFASKPIWDYAAYSLAINAAYAAHNGYVIKILTDNNYNVNDDRWTKVKILEEAIDPMNVPSVAWATHLDYIVWMDGIVT